MNTEVRSLYEKSQRDRLQKHLSLLRSCAGWTAEVFAKKLEISRATVSTLEKEGHALTMMQYLAIHKLFEDEIAHSSGETEMLASVLEVIVDNPAQYTADERHEVLAKAKLMAPTVLKLPSERKSMNNAWKALVVASGVIATVALSSLLEKKNS